MRLLVEALEKFRDALANENQTQLPGDLLSDYEGSRAEFNRDFYGTYIVHPEIHSIILEILNKLHVPEYQMGRYTYANLKVNDFFTELYQYNKKENEKLKQFNALIDERNKTSWTMIIGYGLLAAAGIGGLIPVVMASGGLTFIQQILALALVFPSVGLIFTIAVAVYSIYNKHSDTSIPFLERCRDNAFLIANAVINVAAYCVVISTAATAMVPVASILFVMAALINVARDIVSIIAHAKKSPPLIADAPIGDQEQDARDQNEHATRRNALLINLVTAITLSAVIAIWCFFPGGIFVSIGALVVIGLINLGCYFVQQSNENVMKERLQGKFIDLEKAYLEKHPQPDLQDRQSMEQGIVDEPDVSNAGALSESVTSFVLSNDATEARLLGRLGVFANSQCVIAAEPGETLGLEF